MPVDVLLPLSETFFSFFMKAGVGSRNIESNGVVEDLCEEPADLGVGISMSEDPLESVGGGTNQLLQGVNVKLDVKVEKNRELVFENGITVGTEAFH